MVYISLIPAIEYIRYNCFHVNIETGDLVEIEGVYYISEKVIHDFIGQINLNKMKSVLQLKSITLP